MAQDMLAKVRALVDTAESLEAQGNAEAGASYRAKAEDLMRKYRIEEEELIAQDPTSVEPVRVRVVIIKEDNPFRQQYVNLFSVIARHAGARCCFDWVRNGTGQYEVVAEAVGYETDTRYAEMLFTAARLVFSDRLEPKVDSLLSDQVNAYRLRSAGMERVKVAELIWGNREKVNLGRVGRYYKAECVKRGEVAALDGRGVTGKVYREQYAAEFVWALEARLRRAQDAAGQMGGGMVLHGRKERVNEAFYTHFPSYRPSTPSTEVAVPKECEACKATKHKSGKCKDCRPRPITKAELARYERYNSPAAQRGRQAGATAAAHVELKRGYHEQVTEGTPTDSKAVGR